MFTLLGKVKGEIYGPVAAGCYLMTGLRMKLMLWTVKQRK